MLGNTFGIGNILTEEHKQKLREFHTGNEWSKGRKLTEEHKQAILKANIGNQYTKGRVLSEEHKQKISAGLLKRNQNKRNYKESLEN